MSLQRLNTVIQDLVDGWCERRELAPLRIVLPTWPMPNGGLTDESHELWQAMRHVRAVCRDIITEDEKQKVNEANAILAAALTKQ